MNRLPSRSIRLVLAFLGVGLFMGIGISFVPREPTYQGHTVRHWTKLLWAGAPAERTAAEEAIRSLGTNAAPVLARMLQQRDSQIKRIFMDASARQSLVRYPYLDRDIDQKRLALKAASVLGDSARVLLPTLQQIIGDWKNESVDVVYGAIDIAKGFAPQSTPQFIVGEGPPRLVYPTSATQP